MPLAKGASAHGKELRQARFSVVQGMVQDGLEVRWWERLWGGKSVTWPGPGAPLRACPAALAHQGF